MAHPVSRACAIWLILLVAAVMNGAMRQGVLVPFWGEGAAHYVSTVLLALIIFFVALLLSPWLNLDSRRQAWVVGLLWMMLTVAFEFGAGHFVFGTPWSKLLADYHLTEGRIWIIIPLAMLLTPPTLYRMHG